MITEEELLKEIKKGVEDCRTLHYVIIDSTVCKDSNINIAEELLSDKNLAWLEPQDGVYVINTHLLSHFINYFDNLFGLIQKLVNCGYVVNSLRFGRVMSQRKFNFEDKPEDSLVRIAIVTMFSNKAFVEYWKTFLRETCLPENIIVDVILGDNSDDNKIRDLLYDVMSQCGRKYNNYYICDLGKSYQIKEGEHYLAIDKHVHVAVNYSELLREPSLHYDYILKIEDDMEPPNDGFQKLYKHMKNLKKQKKKVACVAGYYPQKLNPLTTCISMQPELWGKIPRVDEMQPRLIRVEMQGGGFALYNCKALQEVLPYKLTYKLPHGNYYMTGWDGTIGEEWAEDGWEQYVDGSMYCEHNF